MKVICESIAFLMSEIKFPSDKAKEETNLAVFIFIITILIPKDNLFFSFFLCLPVVLSVHMFFTYLNRCISRYRSFWGKYRVFVNMILFLLISIYSCYKYYYFIFVYMDTSKNLE